MLFRVLRYAARLTEKAGSMTKIQIELPDLTAIAAREAGLLTSAALDRLLTDALRRHGRSIMSQMAQVMVSRGLFQHILNAIAALRPLPPARC